MKKFLLLASLALGIFPALPALAAQGDLDEITASEYALQQSIMFPHLDGQFHGEGMVSRLEFALSIVNYLYGKEDFDGCYRSISPSATGTFALLFTDVKSDEWYGKPLCAGMRAGLFQGDASGSFRPFAPITTAESSKIVARAYGLLETPDGLQPWYAKPMDALSARGAIAESARPQALLTRDEMAQMFYALRTVPGITVYTIPVPAEEENAAVAPLALPPAETPPAMQPVEIPAAALPQESCAPVAAGPGSPGAAMMTLGQEGISRSIVRASPRVLRQNVETTYQNKVIDGAQYRARALEAANLCGALAARSPGAEALLQGVHARPETVTRLPNRVLQQQVEDRSHDNGIAPSAVGF